MTYSIVRQTYHADLRAFGVILWLHAVGSCSKKHQLYLHNILL